ncbi:hypothetical protein BC938DRAFT_475145, partial [Jimgerdemannia flammicorona]
KKIPLEHILSSSRGNASRSQNLNSGNGRIDLLRDSGNFTGARPGAAEGGSSCAC